MTVIDVSGFRFGTGVWDMGIGAGKPAYVASIHERTMIMMFCYSASIFGLYGCGCDEGFDGEREENGWDEYTPFSSDILVPTTIPFSPFFPCSSTLLVPESASSRLFSTGPMAAADG